MRPSRAVILTSTLLLAGLGVARSARTAGADQEAPAAPPAVIVPFFGNQKCPFTGETVKANAYVNHQGQRVYFCSKACVAKAKADPGAAYAQAYAEVRRLANPTCPVSGKEIDAGKAHVVAYQGFEVQLCCADCEKKFRETPTRALTRLVYPDAKEVGNETCPVMEGEAIDPEMLAIFQGHVVHFCCESCIDDFRGDPQKFLEIARKGG